MASANMSHRRHHVSWILIVILAFAFFTRMFRLHLPERYIFDEVYHAVTAKLIARNDPRAFEWWHAAPEPQTAIDWLHPPYAKYTQAMAMRVFGENSFGWRLSSALFGLLVILMTYKVALVLMENEKLALSAAALASFDGLLLVQSRIAMNDIHVTFWILVAIYAFARHWRLTEKQLRWTPMLALAGVAGGLAVGTKWSGLFVILLMIAWESWRILAQLILNHKHLRQIAIPSASHFFRVIFIFIIIPTLLYVLSYSQMFIQGKGWEHFRDLHQQIWWYQTNLTATHPYQSRPYEWFFNLKPVWYHVDHENSGRIGNIYAFGNPFLFFLAIVSLIASVVRLGILTVQSSRQKVWGIEWPWLLLLSAYLGMWIPWQFSPRIMFFYHFTPAVPLMSVFIAFWLHQLPSVWRNTILGVTLGFFILWYPHWTGITVPIKFADTVYFAVKSWR